MDKKKHTLVEKTLRHKKSGNQDPVWLFRPEQKVAIMDFSDYTTRLNLVSADIVITNGS